jgi:hypothetical protein
MITETEIEAFAIKIAVPDFRVSNIGRLIGHLDPADFNLVLEHAAQLARQRGEANLVEADALENLMRVAHATGMPAGGKPIPWLRDRGLIEEADGVWRFKVAKPGAVT